MLRAEFITIHSMYLIGAQSGNLSMLSHLSRVQLFPTSRTYQALMSSTISWSLLKFMCVELVMLSNHLILYCPLVLPGVSQHHSLPVSQLFGSGGQNTGASASVLPVNIQD